MKRFSIYLKDGRTASVTATKIDPNVDRPFMGQARGFIIVSSDEGEAAVFLSTDVLGWTVEPLEDEVPVATAAESSEWTPAVVTPIESYEREETLETAI